MLRTSILMTCFVFLSCSKPEAPVGGNTQVSNACLQGTDLSQIPDQYLHALTQFTNSKSSYQLKVCTEDSNGDGQPDYMVVVSTNVPDHESSYFAVGHAQREEYDYNTNLYKYGEAHTDQHAHSAGDNLIKEQNIVMRMPIAPTQAQSPTKTDYATIGLATNGVSFFNENAAPGDEITNELFTFDQCSGHPQQEGVYHYHVDPVCLIRDLGGSVVQKDTTVAGKTYEWLVDSGTNGGLLIGMLMDGFPVYGPRGANEKDCKGNSNLPAIDSFNGHKHCTNEFPAGIYHYHVKTGVAGATGETVFWITNTYYYGEPGSIGTGI